MQAPCSLSDEATEFQIKDRLSCPRPSGAIGKMRRSLKRALSLRTEAPPRSDRQSAMRAG